MVRRSPPGPTRPGADPGFSSAPLLWMQDVTNTLIHDDAQPGAIDGGIRLSIMRQCVSHGLREGCRSFEGRPMVGIARWRIGWPGILLLVVGLGVMPGQVEAGMLNPKDFVSLGSLPDLNGSYDFVTDGSAPILHLRGGGTINGVLDPSGRIAGFTFDSISLNQAAVVTARGSRPLALLSQGNLVFSGTMLVTAGGGSCNKGPGAGGGYMSGGGGGFGGAGGAGGPTQFDFDWTAQSLPG